MAAKTWIYFMRSGENGPIKIGFTGNTPMARLSALQTGNPEPLNLIAAIPGVREDETRLHERFAALRIKGEWFRADPELIGFVDGIRMAHREQPKHYDDLFAWDEWMDTIAEYCAVWNATTTIKDIEIGDSISEQGQRYLELADMCTLERSLHVLTLAGACDWKGARFFEDDLTKTMQVAGNVVRRQPRPRGLTPEDFYDIHTCCEVSSWLGAAQSWLEEEGPMDAPKRRRALAAWMKGVEVVGAVRDPGENYGNKTIRSIYIGICGNDNVDHYVRILNHLLRLLREAGCRPTRTEIPDWLEPATAAETLAEAN